MLESLPSSPATSLQQGMLFHALFAPGSGVDIEQVVMSLHEPIDVSAFQRAWDSVLERHAVLRSCFDWGGNSTPRQVTLESAAVSWQLLDWRRVPENQRREQLEQFLAEDRGRDFAMDQAPLMRLTLVSLDDERFQCIWTFHHAILDGRSFPIVLADVFEAYAGRAHTHEPGWSAPTPFSDFQGWLHQRCRDHEAPFWREELRGFTAPTPVSPNLSSGTRAAPGPQIALERQVSPDLTTQLEAASRHLSITLNAFLQGAWGLLLSQYLGPQEGTRDVVIGTTRACRHSSVPRSDSMVGLLINTVPLRIKWDDQTTTADFLKRIRATGLAMRAVEHTPLTDIQRWSDVPAGLPLFESLVVFEKQTLNDQLRARGGEWTRRSFEYRGKTSFPLTLIAYGGQQLLLRIEADSRRFDRQHISRMLGHLEELLKQMLSHLDMPVNAVPFVPREEVKELLGLSRVRATSIAPWPTLHQWFESWVERTPDHVAVTSNGQNISYEELNRRANRLAHFLRTRGVGPDVLVGLATDRDLEVVVGILGILKAGGAYVPIDLAYPAQRLAFMLDDSRAPILLTQRALVPKLPETKAELVCLDDSPLFHNFPESNPEPINSLSDLAYVIYTSGSTGAPKGALVTHENVTRLFSATEAWFGFGPKDVWTLFHSYAFDFSVWELWGALLYGGRLVVVSYLDSRSPEDFYELLSRERVTVLNQTPSAFRQLMQAEAALTAPLPLSLRYVVFGGEALEMQSLKPWFDRHGDQQPRLINMYGITETTVHVTYRPLSANDVERGSAIGVPIPDLEILILDSRGRPVPIGVPGEMYVGGKGLARGYLRRDELTARRFIPHPFDSNPTARLYRTGDLARFLPDHDIEYLGRIDQQVKLRGFRIEMGEIESVLCEHPHVRETVVIAREDHPGEKRLVAYVVCDAPAPSHGQLREHLKGKLPDYMVPTAFVLMEKLPLTNNGKVDKKLLPVPDDQRPDLADRYVAPRTPVEEQLSRIWCDVLRIERVGVDDNYFEIGGDSIQSTLIVSAARKLGIQLTPRQLFECPTIARLAAVAVQCPKEAMSPVQETVTGECPLTPIQHWFFEQRLADSQHYNQAFLFELLQPLEAGPWTQAMAAVQERHDGFRLRFRNEDGLWRPTYGPVTQEIPFEEVDLSVVPPERMETEIAGLAEAIQARLDYERGPLWRVAVFHLADGSARLLVVVHHLVVDGVSWRILLEDLEQAYRLSLQATRVVLEQKSSSFKSWAEHLQRYAQSEHMARQRPYWERCATALAEPLPVDLPRDPTLNVEASTEVVPVSLSEAETQDLIQRVPSAYNTQVNDILLTALAQAMKVWTGRRQTLLNLEGHGREDLFAGVDLTRTIGWFTTIFPVRLELPLSTKPQDAIRAIKEQLRSVPERGIGYGVLRYLAHSEGAAGNAASLQVEPDLVFNYLGRFDDVVRGSRLFRFAKEQSGAWHGSRQQRRHLLEINCLILHRRLEIRWTYSRALHHRETMERVANEFLQSLRGLIQHCVSSDAGGYTPSDFPLCELDQTALDRLLDGLRDVQDVYPPSPLQVLFLAQAARQRQSVLDHWQCKVSGPLDTAAFQKAWQEVIDRHPILRTCFRSSGHDTLQVVRRQVAIPWKVEDWTDLHPDLQRQRWEQWLKSDRECGMDLEQAPLSRFTLVRLQTRQYQFLWSIPALLLDGWSWPLVFAEVSKVYQAIADKGSCPSDSSESCFPETSGGTAGFPRPPAYREYLRWLREYLQQCELPSNNASEPSPREFWRANLAGITEPTPLPAEAVNDVCVDLAEAFERVNAILTESTASQLLKTARMRQITAGALIQAAWSIVLSHMCGRRDVLFGAAFSGRPTELADAESMVGPFVNLVPVRVGAIDNEKLVERLTRVHRHLVQLNRYQFVPTSQIQSWSEVPWHYRLCDSVVVVQNYLVDDAARRLGDDITLDDLDGPIHTNFPLLVLAEPKDTWRISLIFDRRVLPRAAVERWTADLLQVFQTIVEEPEIPIDQLWSRLSRPTSSASPRRKLFVQSQNYVSPQTSTQKSIAEVWKNVIGLERVSIEDNLFDLGVHSLLVVQLHQRLQEKLGKPIGLVNMFRYPTIYSLAQHLDAGPGGANRLVQTLDRGQRQRQTLAAMKDVRSRMKP